MKRAITFSIEDNIVSDFLKDTGDNRNFVLEKIMIDYLVSKKEVGAVTCKTCGAIYSERMAVCPQCKLKERLDKKEEDRKMTLEQMKTRLKMLERVKTNDGYVTDDEINDLREKIGQEEKL